MELIEPSLLSINKEDAINDLKRIKKLGLNLVHYDVMDGKFVPQTSFKTEYLSELQQLKIKSNVHLMVEDPENWIDMYKGFAVKSITFHAETQSVAKAKQILKKIHKLGFLAGFSVKPDTDLNKYKELFKDSDIILIMSVEPGWGGQSFVEKSLINLDKAVEAKKVNKKLIIEIDGGINNTNIPKLADKVDWFVTGSWFFKNIDLMGQYLARFKKLI